MKHDDHGANLVPFHVHEGPGVVTFIDMEGGGRGVGLEEGTEAESSSLLSVSCARSWQFWRWGWWVPARDLRPFHSNARLAHYKWLKGRVLCCVRSNHT